MTVSRKVAVFGKGPLAVFACEEILRMDGLNLEFIVPCAPEPKWSQSLTKWASTKSVPVIAYSDFASGSVEHLDLGISCYFDKIFRPRDLALMGLGINVHNSLLPKYAGRRPVERAYASSDSVIGVTLHQMDFGIDTGPIFAQMSTPLNRDLSLYEVYDQCVLLGKQLLHDFLVEYPTVRFSPQRP